MSKPNSNPKGKRRPSGSFSIDLDNMEIEIDQNHEGRERDISEPLMNSEIQKTPVWVYVLLFLFAGLSLLTIPQPFHPVHGQEPTILHVFYYGWLTALSTGLGALPFLLFPDIQSYWVGISNGT